MNRRAAGLFGPFGRVVGGCGSAIAGCVQIVTGLALALVRRFSIPVSNSSVNPVRSPATAMFAETGAPSHLRVMSHLRVIRAVPRLANLQRLPRTPETPDALT